MEREHDPSNLWTHVDHTCKLKCVCGGEGGKYENVKFNGIIMNGNGTHHVTQAIRSNT